MIVTSSSNNKSIFAETSAAILPPKDKIPQLTEVQQLAGPSTAPGPDGNFHIHLSPI